MTGNSPSPPASLSGLPPSMDVWAVGRSVFGEPRLPAPPVVEGFSEAIWLAEGGFGTVWRARDAARDREVALKIPHYTDPEVIERVEAEAGALKALNHPHIVQLYDITAAADGTPVLVMELVNAPPLTARLPHAGFDFKAALEVFLPVLDAVRHAHGRGIVHLDLKPGNILLAQDNTPKVTDFGLAQPLQGQRINFALTRSGVVAGTVEYLAPERYEPQPGNGIASDIYALGIILYELLTGRPPRGAWQPPSRLKRLDVRLDELILHAIHPDPLKRLSAAESFQSRLVEIRDTRPRYAGTPLVTTRVRMIDAVWTVTGLYCLAAAFCALLRINNTAVPAVFDLSFGHTYMLGGFWALWVLTVVMGFLWLWQSIRLWHFRRIPLREALPAPFGVHAGRSRAAAVIVALTQLCCVWAPLLYMGWIWSLVWHWADPETPSWHRVLAVTRWGSDIPVSMWTWDPSGFFSGDKFWVREMQPGYPGQTWQLHDRQSFHVVIMPLIMTVGVIMIGTGILVTAVATAVEWKNRRRTALFLFVAGLVSACFYQRTVAQEETQWRAERFAHGPAESDGDRRLRSAFPRLRHFLDYLYTGNGDHSPVMETDFAGHVRTGPDRSVPREVLFRTVEEMVEQNRRSHLIAEALRLDGTAHTREESGLEFFCEAYSDLPGQPAIGEAISIALSCRDQNADGWITAWEEKTTLLYTAEPRSLSGPEAKKWLGDFLNCLNRSRTSDLEPLFLPVVLAPNPDAPRNHIPVPREALMAALRKGLHNGEPGLTAVSHPEWRLLSGARNELNCRLKDRTGRTLHWRVELVFSEGAWRVMRLRM